MCINYGLYAEQRLWLELNSTLPMLAYLNWPQFLSIDCDRMPMLDVLSLIDSFVFAPRSACALGLMSILAYQHLLAHMSVFCVNIMTRFLLDTSSKYRSQMPSWLRWKHDSSHANVSPISHFAFCVNGNAIAWCRRNLLGSFRHFCAPWMLEFAHYACICSWY